MVLHKANLAIGIAHLVEISSLRAMQRAENVELLIPIRVAWCRSECSSGRETGFVRVAAMSNSLGMLLAGNVVHRTQIRQTWQVAARRRSLAIGYARSAAISIGPGTQVAGSVELLTRIQRSAIRRSFRVPPAVTALAHQRQSLVTGAAQAAETTNLQGIRPAGDVVHQTRIWVVVLHTAQCHHLLLFPTASQVTGCAQGVAITSLQGTSTAESAERRTHP